MYYCCSCNKPIYKQQIFNNINLDEIDKISRDYFNSHNKKFDFYQTIYSFEIQLDNNIKANTETKHHNITDYLNLEDCLLFLINSCQSRGYNFIIINHITIKILTCMCNMSYKYYINQPMSMLERRINFIIAKNPQLINSFDRNKNHPLIRKYSYINEYNKYY